MNLSKLITRIKLNIGIYGIALPIENLNETIEMIIKDITLPVFSLYCPNEERQYLNIDKLEQLEKNTNYISFLLPDYTSRKLLYIKNIEYDNRSISGIGAWGDVMPYPNGMTLRDLMIGNAASNLVNLTIPRLNFQFKPPRRVYLYNLVYTSSLAFDLLFQHDPSLQSIPTTAEESFFTLACLDVKANLYQTVKHYTDIQTPHGNIQLKIDDWQQAESERKELLNQWDDTYHLDLGQMTWS